MSTLIELEIDGQAVQVPPGSTVMDAARQLGRYIPHFCFHKKLSIAANCRMCLVEVEKAPKPLPACATPAAAGMKVHTESAFAREAQHGVMEFLLINHPLDCPICDQGGECQLQDLAVGYGQSSSAYTEPKRVVINKNLGPLINTDMTRCIHCTRCVRFGQEVAGIMELGMAHRGEAAEILTFMKRAVTSELSGNVIDLCPVGALTSKPFRFAARSWEMVSHPGISPHDSLGSNLQIQVLHNQVKRVLPVDNEAINECWLSDRDRFSYEALKSSNRLHHCQIRHGRQWESIDRQSALEQAAADLRAVIEKHGPQSVGFLTSPQATLEEMYLFGQLARGLGCDNIDFRPRQRDVRLDRLRRGIPWLGLTLSQLSSADSILVIGSGLRSAQPLLAQRLRQMARQGRKVSFVDTGGDDPLMPMLAHWRVAPSALLSALQDIAAAMRGESSTTSATATTIAQGLKGSNGSGKAVVILSPYLQADAQGAAYHALAQAIAQSAQATLSVPGAGANVVGGYVADCLPRNGGLSAAQMFAEPRKAYVLLHCEPELDHAQGPQALHALKSAEVVVTLTTFQGIVEQYAKTAIPIAPFSEMSGTFVNMEGRLQAFRAAISPPEEVTPGWKVLRVLGTLLGIESMAFDNLDQVREACLRKTSAHEKGFVSGLDNTIATISEPDRQSAGNAAAQPILERIALVPGYSVDPLVRRAPSLQQSEDGTARLAYFSAATLQRINGEVGQQCTFIPQEEGGVEMLFELALDNTLPLNCVRIAAGHAHTWMLGDVRLFTISTGGVESRGTA